MKPKTNFPEQYISSVKALFPICRKEERRYLKRLQQNLTDYCEDVSVSSIDMLYDEFGSPQDAVHSYYSMMDIHQLVSLIHIKKIICLFFIALLIVIFAFFIYLSTILYSAHVCLMSPNLVSIDTYFAPTRLFFF